MPLNGDWREENKLWLNWLLPLLQKHETEIGQSQNTPKMLQKCNKIQDMCVWFY